MNTVKNIKNKFFAIIKKYKKSSIVAGIVLIFVVGYFAFGSGGNGNDETVNVTRGSIVQEITVTGKTKPVDNVDLAFEKGGKVQSVSVSVGSRVVAGQSLAHLDTSELSAQLLQAQANVETQQAKLDDLRIGTRPEDIQIQQSAVEKAQQDLDNEYNSVPDVLNDAYSQADDAVRQQTDALFNNDEDINPQLSFKTTNAQAEIDASTQRYAVGQELKNWKNELNNLSSLSTQGSMDQALAFGRNHLSIIRAFLNRTSDALVGQINLSSTTVTTYKASLTAARSAVNAQLTAVNGEAQALAAQKLVVQQATDQLRLKQAGNTPQTIKAQEAQVLQARASAQQINAQIAKSTLHAPFAGVVTKQDAKVGQIASAGLEVISLISDGNLSIEANVSEVDIGKLAVGNPVHITLDAFPGEEFSGKVTYIDPGETVVDGVVNFKVTIAFDKPDTRLKSGLTTNLTIETDRKDGVLLLPQYAIVENDQGTFVRERVDEKTTKDLPISVGIRGADGMVEIISGAKEGLEVLNIGSKTSQ